MTASHDEFARYFSPAQGARGFEPLDDADLRREHEVEARAHADAVPQNEGIREHEAALDGRHARSW